MERKLPLLCRLPWPFGHRWGKPGEVPNLSIVFCVRCGGALDRSAGGHA